MREARPRASSSLSLFQLHLISPVRPISPTNIALQDGDNRVTLFAELLLIFPRQIFPRGLHRMRLGYLVTGSVLLSLSLPCFAHSRSRRGSSSAHSFSHRATRAVAKLAGQHSIDDTRASEIQQALSTAGYLSETPTGHWDATTQSAMQRYQSDHGWQTKLIPDSRAIIKLGLGPQTNADTPISSLQ